MIPAVIVSMCLCMLGVGFKLPWLVFFGVLIGWGGYFWLEE
jgi:hypothetical protein